MCPYTATYVPRPVIWTATTEGLTLLPSGGFLNVICDPRGEVKSRFVSAAATLSRSVVPAYFSASTRVTTLS
jgi:hypothetical protein